MAKLAVSVPEAAEMLGISIPSMYQLVHVAGFPSIRIGKRWLISIRGLEEWVYHSATEKNLTEGGET